MNNDASIEEGYSGYISNQKKRIQEFIEKLTKESKDGISTRVFFTIRKREIEIDDQQKETFQWRYWVGINETDLLKKENKKLIDKEELDILLKKVRILFGENSSPYVFTGKDASGEVGMFHHWGIGKTNDLEDGHFSYKKRICNEPDLPGKDQNCDFNNIKEFINSSVQESDNKYSCSIPQKYTDDLRSFKKYIRSIDYHFLFKRYDYFLYHSLIIGAYHVFTFYINFKFESPGSEEEKFLEKLWESVKKKEEGPVFNEEILFEIEKNDAREYWFNFLKIFESYTNHFYQNIINNFFQTLVKEMSATADFTSFIKKTISFLLRIDESEITYDTNKKSVNEFISVDYGKNVVNIKKPEDKPDEKVLNQEIIEGLVEAAISLYHNTLIPWNQNILRNAIITILVDSYAHNISAHSIHAIEAWMRENSLKFQKRYKIGETDLTRSCEILKKLRKNDLDDLMEMVKKCSEILTKKELEKISQTAEHYYDLMGQKNGTFNKEHFSLHDLIYFGTSWEKLTNQLLYKGDDGIDCELKFDFVSHDMIWKFMRYLKEKAAFWSGVTRNVVFSGIHISIYNLLWDFANNPLFLGTIASSEDFFKVNIYVSLKKTLIADFSEVEPKFKPLSTGDEEISGEFAQIDMSIMNDNFKSTAIDYTDKNVRIEYSSYGVLRPGSNFKTLKERLLGKQHFIYLPGGIVGKQAFYTILENTIRNVKHIKDTSEIKSIKDKGINLCIEITPVGENIDDDFFVKWFKIRIYLKHESNLIDNEGPIDTRINNISKSSIVDEHGNPKMGGNTQDKICAAMLYLNDFYKVQDKDKRFDEIGPNVYPWITTEKILNEDDRGYLAKYFYLWKGDFIMNKKVKTSIPGKESNGSRENKKRFNFYIGDVDEAREEGIIRFYNKEISIINNAYEKMKEDIYEDWLKTWLKKEYKTKIYRSEISSDGNVVPKGCFDLSGKIDCERSEKCVLELMYAHRAGQNIINNALSYSSHGEFASYFHLWPQKSKEKLKYFEFLEIILTRIAVIDNRIFNLLRMELDLRSEYSKATKISILKKRLLLEVYPESSELETLGEIDFSFNISALKEYHFVVIHLSYIENVLKYKEENITEFIKEKIIKNNPNIPDNFILVITTARGRIEWWEKLKKSPEWYIYKKFVTFRPIESIINAVSDGRALSDDFQIKINLARVLLGA
ncbi:MAG: hypothetical protein NT166_04570 [Candidatus Aminicenantes bacterium]|nr:hypothetical protein [Candidatus Aminicenantes bacterium]